MPNNMEDFEKDIEAAFRQAKRQELKAMLQQTEHEIVEKKETIIKPMFRWWQYAAAACVVLGIGFAVYRLNLAPLNPYHASEQAVVPKLDEPKTPKKDNSPQTKPTENPIAPQSFTFDIKESQSLGFGNDPKKKLQGDFIKDKSLDKGIISYKLSEGKLTLQANQLPKIQSVISYNDTLYLKINNRFYKLIENKYLKRLKSESDPVVIQELKKIDFE
jgi:hypothetical protein